MPSSLRRFAAILASLAAPGIVLGVLLFGLAAPAQAANIVVTTCTAANLRAAIISATATTGGLVTFACPGGSHTFTITQTQDISRAVTIDGGGVITISGGNTDRIFNVPDSEKATLLNLTLTHGSASQGGALRVAGLAVITNVTFVSNTATGAGGALAVLSLGTADIYTSRFLSNTANDGGAVASSGALGVALSTFSANLARSGGALMQSGGTALVADSRFTGNQGEFGGAISAAGSLVLAGDELDHNQTSLSFIHAGPEGGGGLYVTGPGVVQIRNSQFFANSADNGGLGGLGGAIINGGVLTVTNTLFNLNGALQDGGALYNAGLANLETSSFLRNSALGDGGAISNTQTLVVQNSAFYSNTAAGSGGALANRSEVTALFSQWVANSASGGGGALRNATHGNLNLLYSTFYSNSANGAGGAILNGGSLLAASSTFVANAAGVSGGAIQSSGTLTPEATLYEVTVVSNTAASAGAALRRIDGSFVLYESIVAFNGPANCQGSFSNLGFNLQFGGLSCGASITNADPRLGPLQDNGGPRAGVAAGVGLLTLRPLAGSPAIGAVTSGSCHFGDERGYPATLPCDIGAIQTTLRLWLPLMKK